MPPRLDVHGASAVCLRGSGATGRTVARIVDDRASWRSCSACRRRPRATATAQSFRRRSARRSSGTTSSCMASPRLPSSRHSSSPPLIHSSQRSSLSQRFRWIRRSSDRRGAIWPLRRPHRPQDTAHYDDGPDGRRHDRHRPDPVVSGYYSRRERQGKSAARFPACVAGRPLAGMGARRASVSGRTLRTSPRPRIDQLGVPLRKALQRLRRQATVPIGAAEAPWPRAGVSAGERKLEILVEAPGWR